MAVDWVWIVVVESEVKGEEVVVVEDGEGIEE